MRYSCIAPDSYVGDFQDIRSWIDRIVSRWREIPDPKEIDNWREAFQPVVDAFGFASVKNGNIVYPHDGTLWTNLEEGATQLFGDVNEDGESDDDEGLRGRAISAFKQYYQQLVNAVHACGVVVQVVDASLEAEAAVWRAASYGAPQTVHRIAGICERLAGKAASRDIGISDILNIGSKVLGVASLAPAPYKVPAKVGSFILFAAATATYPGNRSFSAFEWVDPPRPPIPSYSGAIEVLSLLLNGSNGSVDQVVTTVEQSIWDTSSAAISAIVLDPDQLFNPKAAPITAPPKTLVHDRKIALEVVKRTANVAAKLSTAASAVQSCREAATGAVMKRHSRIGIGPQGPYSRLDELMFYLGLALRELGDEADAAAVNLRTVVEVLDEAEANRRALIQSTARDFTAADSGYVSHYHGTLAEDARPPAIPDFAERMGARS